MANISKIKVSGVTYNIVDSSAIHSLEGYWNSGETQNAITAATNALAETIADCMKAKVEGMGIDNIEGQDLVELGMWTDIIKDLVCYDKDKKIIEAMDEAEESEEAMKYIEMYEDYPERKGYRGQRRDSRGRYMSNRGRRGYEIPMMMYDEDWDEMERMRDYDRGAGKMYYSGSGSSGGSSNNGQSSSGMSGSSSSMGSGQSSGSMGSQNGNRGYSESRYDRARRGYEESKAMHKSGSVEDKKKNMESLEHYMKELSEEMAELIESMDANEKTMVRSKLQTLAQKVQ